MSSKIESEKIDSDNKDNNDTTIELQLGDVIKINSEKNEKLNDQTFIIDYIDKSKMYLINVETLDRIKQKISEDGTIGDGGITQIAILSRSDTSSYAKQHDLLPGKWVNIFFGGNYPVIIIGEITNLEQDMIEVKSVDGDTLYINFDFKGIPEDLPIENIEIREKPEKTKKTRFEEEEEKGVEGVEREEGEEEEGEEVEGVEGVEGIQLPELGRDKRFIETSKLQINVPTRNIKDQLREFIIRADQIKFGDEELGAITQYVDVSDKYQRYSIENQLTDLLDDILTTIPNAQRTERVLNNIHTMIERFKQLRENFSSFDQYGNVNGYVVKESSYKPLSDYFNNFKQNLYWILPVVKNIKKVYLDDANYSPDNENDASIVEVNLQEELESITEIMNNYKSNTLPIDQNKYTLLNTDLNKFFTPFDMINEEDTDGILIEKKVEVNLNTVIDTLEDMYSSVYSKNNIRNRRFVIQKYNLGSSKLDTLDATSSRLITTRVKMTNPEIMSIKSFITLPEPTIRFSRINLPGSSLLDKANLNQLFLNYWEFLKKKTTVNNVIVEDINNELTFNNENYVNNIKNYVLSLSSEDKKGLTTQEIYSSFIKTIVPKTKILFDLMKKYITGKLSIVEVVGYLEPFLIYTDDLTYKQYVEINNFISEKISEYNKTFIERARLFVELINKQKIEVIFKNAYSLVSIIENKTNLRTEVFESYDITIGNDLRYKFSDFTNSEILRKMIIKDSNRLYTSSISLESAPLMFPSEFSSILDKEKLNINNKYEDELQKDTCKTMIIAKHYNSIDSLNQDNDKNIYFDKKYDKTNYGLLDNYEKEIMTMNPDNLKIFIMNDLRKKEKLDEKAADYLANTLLDGHKLVLPGQYAFLYKGTHENPQDESDYYVRRENKWEIDNDAAKDLNTDDSSVLCNLQKKCISVSDKFDDKCESMFADELGMKNKLLKDVIGEFDIKYKMSRDEFDKNVKERFEYLKVIIEILAIIEKHNMLKYNNQKYRLGYITEDDKPIKPVSPYASLLNLILGQQDFIKKQNDINRFVAAYTRPAITDGFGPLNEKENIYWLYCLKSNVALLPTFRYELAVVFIVNPESYNSYLDTLKTNIGKLSDDGDMWCDENSGWPICPVDFDVEEGYDEGFKISTRSILEQDAGNLITSTSKTTIKYITPETRMILNIVDSLSISMGINIDNQKEFIVNCVSTSLKETLESEEDYKDHLKRKADEGKKVMSYKDFYNSGVIYYTFGMVLIAIQTSIPSVKTRKTHPGCVRSFSGYPFEGSGDNSSLTYLTCIIYDSRTSVEPWNVLKGKKQDFISNKIKGSINDVLLGLPDVKRKFEDKTEYLLTTPTNAIPEEHDIKRWTQFLPPLVPFKIKRLANISDEFKKSLINDLRSGSENQREKLLVIDSKIITYSLAIQEKIQEVLKNKDMLLSNSNNEPYLENSCCQTKEGESTIEYFMTQDGLIKDYNTIVEKLTNILQDINSYSTSGMFYSEINTKNKYPSLSKDFDEKTIYLSFIYFCKFKSLAPIPEDLIPLCTDKPDISLMSMNESFDKIIQKLKDDGRNFNNESFLRLLQLISRNNIIDIELDSPYVSSIAKLIITLEEIQDENEDVIEGSLRKLILEAVDTFDIATDKMTKEIKNLNDYLIKNNEEMKNEIIDFIEKNKGSDITRSSVNKMKNALTGLSDWEVDKSTRNENKKISDDGLYNIINFYKTFIDNFVTVFPNIILNKVNYSSIQIPNYLGLSNTHALKIKTSIREYYEGLKSLYGVPGIYNILNTIQKSCKNIVKLSKETPSFTTIRYGERVLKPVFDERTSKFLFEYYLLRILLNYIELTDDVNMIVSETTRDTTEQELFSVEYLEDRDTRVDFEMTSRTKETTNIISGNKKGLRQKTAEILLSFIDIMEGQKNTIDVSYDNILDKIFKLKEKEKDLITDRLKTLTDEERDADTILKVNKLGVWNKGLQKSLRNYTKEGFDDEREFRDEMDKTEKNIRNKNKNVTDDNIDIYIEDELEQMDRDNDIEREENNMNGFTDDYDDGNFDGEEVENYGDYN
jgi:hypothetical protein